MTTPHDPITDAGVLAWAERHDVKGNITDLRCMFEDAASWHLTLSAPPKVAEEPIAWMRNNRKECITAESKAQMEKTDFGYWKEIAASYTIPLYPPPSQAAAQPALPKITIEVIPIIDHGLTVGHRAWLRVGGGSCVVHEGHKDSCEHRAEYLRKLFEPFTEAAAPVSPSSPLTMDWDAIAKDTLDFVTPTTKEAPAATGSDEREAFEQAFSYHKLSRYDHGGYIYRHVEALWEGWQARGRQLSAPPAQALSEDEIGLLEYHGNSVSYIFQRMIARGHAIDSAWAALRIAGYEPDGASLGEMVTRALSRSAQAPEETYYCSECGVMEGYFHQDKCSANSTLVYRPSAPKETGK